MESDLALTKVSLKEALERVEVVHHAMTVDLPRVEEVSSLHFWCLSLTPWPFTGCLSMPASCLTGSRDDVNP